MVLETCSECRGIDNSLFQDELKLHLTLCVMVLADERERHDSCQVIKKCHESILNEKINQEPLKLEMRGIEYMNDDPGEVDVLYGKVSTLSSHDLQDIADSYVSNLIKASLIQRQYERVKLHITLMNTLFRRGVTDVISEFGKNKERETFDARQIMEVS